MIRAVIFDLDGTLLNSLFDLKTSMNAMLKSLGYPQHEDIDYHRRAVGFGAREYAKSCLPEAVRNDPGQVEKGFLKFRELYDANPCTETKPYEGIFELLSFLKEQGISVNVLSNKPDAPAKVLVKSRFSEFDFDYIFGEREGVPRKPDPQGALEIAANLKLEPEEILFLGDGEPDVTTGLSAGMLTVGALWGYRDKEQLKACGAKLFAKTPQDVIQLIKEL